MISKKSLSDLISDIKFATKLTQEEIAERLGYSRSYLSQAITSGGTDKMFAAIEREFSEELENVILSAKEKSIRKPKIQEKQKGMPVFESNPATLSNIESYRDTKQAEPDFWLNIPQYKSCDFATRAKGDSMHPIIRNMALVGGRQIHDFKVIVFGDIYIIHTKNGIETVKYIHPDPENVNGILLVPYNGNAKTTPIHRDDILRLYQAEFVLNPL